MLVSNVLCIHEYMSLCFMVVVRRIEGQESHGELSSIVSFYLPDLRQNG